MKALMLASAAAVLVCAGAQAQESKGEWHLGAGWSYFDQDVAKVHAVTVRGGYDFNEYLGLEAEGSLGVTDETYSGSVTYAGNTATGSIDIKLKHTIAAFAKVQYPLNEQFSVFARLGYSRGKAEADVDGTVNGTAIKGSISDTSDGVAYGAGVEWAFAGQNSVRFDYTRHDHDNNVELDQWGVSFVRRF
ncbi:porin family protein [Woodsholea maritima]|uniref:porin family protein n=1 Tax=Woodsholea maritima TaxID=240237 RepID=UPI0003703DF1|nr:porin family protein [Woodsholea maritima]